MCLGGTFDYAERKDRLAEVELELAEPSVWDDPTRAQELGRERSALDTIVTTIDTLHSGTQDARELLEIAAEEDDEAAVAEIQGDLDRLVARLEQLEFRRMFSGEMDESSAFLDIQAGSEILLSCWFCSVSPFWSD